MFKVFSVIAVIATVCALEGLNQNVPQWDARLAYYECTRNSGAITDTEAFHADKSCRAETGYEGDKAYE